MSLASAASAYAVLNIALAAAVTGLLLIETLLRNLRSRQLLALHYGAVAVVLACVTTLPALPQGLLPDRASFWPAQEFPFDGAPHAAYPSLAIPSTYLDAGSAGRVWIAAALALLAFGIFRLLRDGLALRRLRRESQCIRRLGRVQVWVSEQVQVPFSYAYPRAAHVVLPAWLLDGPAQFRMALSHELQHHRQRDTLWLHLFRILTWLCVLNPGIHAWNRRLARVQEYACDEAIVAARRWPAADYARCLLQVATRASRDSQRLPCATPFIRFGDPQVLTRRIEKMLSYRQGSMSRSSQAAIAATLAILVAASAYAASAATREAPAEAVEDTRRAAGPVGETTWPVVAGHVLAGFAGKHHGLDIAAEAGTEVRAYAAGVVEARGSLKGCNAYVQISHSGTIASRYCNLAQIRVKVGDAVNSGDPLGVVAVPPEGQRAHLHFELRHGDRKVDPQEHLPRKTA